MRKALHPRQLTDDFAENKTWGENAKDGCKCVAIMHLCASLLCWVCGKLGLLHLKLHMVGRPTKHKVSAATDYHGIKGLQ